MKETILITGAGPNGVTGRRIKEFFQYKYNLLTPSFRELDLCRKEEVNSYFQDNQIDYVIHSAVIYPQTKEYRIENDDNLKMFNNLLSYSDSYKKLFYFGSGAEFDKRCNITNVTEDFIGNSIPVDQYGFSKFQMNQLARRSSNIYNLRLFGTINPYERFTKNVISNLCAKAIKEKPISLKKDCLFSFIDIDDVAKFIEYGIKNELKYHDYNLTGERSYYISGLAVLIKLIAGNSSQVIIEDSESLNNDYTGSNKRLRQEFNEFTPIVDSLRKVFNYWKDNEDMIETEGIDGRWGKK